MRPPMQQINLARLVAITATVGLAISAFLTWYDITTVRGICSLTGFFGCEKILISPYSRIGIIPLAFVGFLWFAVTILLDLRLMKDRSWLRYLLAWSILALPSVGILVYIEIVVIGAICPLCTSTHLLGLTILILTVIMWRNRHP